MCKHINLAVWFPLHYFYVRHALYSHPQHLSAEATAGSYTKPRVTVPNQPHLSAFSRYYKLPFHRFQIKSQCIEKHCSKWYQTRYTWLLLTRRFTWSIRVIYSCKGSHINFVTSSPFNTLRPRQNGRHFAADIFNCIFLNENVWIPI